MDKDEGGTIDKSEFVDFFSDEIESGHISNEIITKAYNLIDFNNDGDITVKEFLTWQLNVSKEEFVECLKDPNGKLKRKKSFRRKKSKRSKLKMGNELLSPRTPKTPSKRGKFSKFDTSQTSPKSPNSITSSSTTNSSISSSTSDENDSNFDEIDEQNERKHGRNDKIDQMEVKLDQNSYEYTPDTDTIGSYTFESQKTPTIQVANTRQFEFETEMNESHQQIAELKNEIENLKNQQTIETNKSSKKMAKLEETNKELVNKILQYKRELFPPKDKNGNKIEEEEENSEAKKIIRHERNRSEFSIKLANMAKMEQWKDKQVCLFLFIPFLAEVVFK